MQSLNLSCNQLSSLPCRNWTTKKFAIPLPQQLESERSLNFTGKERKKIFDAIISAYPIKINLEMMVNFELEEKLDSIAGGENIQEIVFNLIEWAESRGKLKQLVEAAHEYKPGNTELKNINLDGL